MYYGERNPNDLYSISFGTNYAEPDRINSDTLLQCRAKAFTTNPFSCQELFSLKSVVRSSPSKLPEKIGREVQETANETALDVLFGATTNHGGRYFLGRKL